MFSSFVFVMGGNALSHFLYLWVCVSLSVCLFWFDVSVSCAVTGLCLCERCFYGLQSLL
jgi:hypothetical protein